MGGSHPHGSWCWHDGPLVDERFGGPVERGARRWRRDEGSLEDHLDGLEEELREVRRLLEDRRARRERTRT